MVKVVRKDKETLYQCQECGFYYSEEDWAQKCEDWCQERHTCNLEITRHAKKE